MAHYRQHYQQQQQPSPISITNLPLSSSTTMVNISSDQKLENSQPLSLPLKSSSSNIMMADSPKLLLFYHGDDISGSPIYTVDMRQPLTKMMNDNNHNSSFKHFISQTYQNRAKVIFPKQQQQQQHSSSSSSSSAELIINNNNKEDVDNDEINEKIQFNQNDYDQAQLILDNVQSNDNGLYWCRVDFRWMRTLISTVELKVHGKLFFLCIT